MASEAFSDQAVWVGGKGSVARRRWRFIDAGAQVTSIANLCEGIRAATGGRMWRMPHGYASASDRIAKTPAAGWSAWSAPPVFLRMGSDRWRTAQGGVRAFNRQQTMAPLALRQPGRCRSLRMREHGFTAPQRRRGTVGLG
ncbi:hypothetical protein KCP70_19195 [Salmonella enterica subsp. enterica]|nr:hypothetical protein KCP70_19195 [Salmonella enterica subsp. enterica]